MLAILAQATPDVANGAVWGSIIAAAVGISTLAINSLREDRKDRRLHERLLERIRRADQCEACVGPRDAWIARVAAQHPELGPIPNFPHCDEVADDEHA